MWLDDLKTSDKQFIEKVTDLNRGRCMSDSSACTAAPPDPSRPDLGTHAENADPASSPETLVQWSAVYAVLALVNARCDLQVRDALSLESADEDGQNVPFPPDPVPHLDAMEDALLLLYTTEHTLKSYPRNTSSGETVFDKATIADRVPFPPPLVEALARVNRGEILKSSPPQSLAVNAEDETMDVDEPAGVEPQKEGQSQAGVEPQPPSSSESPAMEPAPRSPSAHRQADRGFVLALVLYGSNSSSDLPDLLPSPGDRERFPTNSEYAMSDQLYRSGLLVESFGMPPPILANILTCAIGLSAEPKIDESDLKLQCLAAHQLVDHVVYPTEDRRHRTMYSLLFQQLAIFAHVGQVPDLDTYLVRPYDRCASPAGRSHPLYHIFRAFLKADIGTFLKETSQEYLESGLPRHGPSVPPTPSLEESFAALLPDEQPY